METVLKRLKHPTRDNLIYLFAKFAFSSMTCCELYYFSAFLTDAAMFSVGIVGMILSVTSILDTLFSLVNGVVLQKVGDLMPWGTYRSWLLVAPPLALVTFIFCFIRFSDNEMVSAVIIIIAFFVSHVVWSLAEAAYITMSVVMTDDTNERAAMSINIGRGQMGSSLIFGFVAGAILAAFGANPFRYVFLAVIFGILYVIGYWLLFAISKGCEDDKATKMAKRERAAKVASVSNRTATVFQMYKIVFTSKNTILMIIAVTLGYAASFMHSGLLFYYFTYCLNSAALMGTFMSVRALVGLLGGWWTPVLLKLCKGSKKWAFVLSCFIFAVGNIINFSLHPNFLTFAVINCLTVFFGGGTEMLRTALYGDCAVECEYKSGKDVRGMVMSFMSLPVKLGIIIKSFLVTAALTMANYVGGMAPSAITFSTFSMAYLIWPAIIFIICGVVTLLYKLPEHRVAEMIEENTRRVMEDQAAVEAALAKMEQN